MIPQRLTFEGLYSYREKVSIDFAKLCEARLFGIFGPVGSGKSSILEAITFALYGETERLNKADGRNYNMMNLKASRLSISFEFLAGEHGSDRYKFEVRMRRNSKNFRDVSTPERSAFRHDGRDWLPLGHADGERVLGIPYEHFIKTIIIPQGRFQDFLAMTSAERTRMLKELFELHRFDLSQPTKVLAAQNKTRLDEVRGKLGEKPMVPESEVEAKDTELRRLDEAIAEAQNKYVTASKALAEQEGIKSLIGELMEIQDMISAMEPDEAEFREREARLKRHLEAKHRFTDLMAQHDNAYRDLRLAIDSSASLEKALESIRHEYALAETAFEEAKRRHDNRDHLRQCGQEMRDMATMRGLDRKSAELSTRIRKGSEVIQQEESSLAQAKAATQALEQDLQHRQSSQPDLQHLLERRQWLQQADSLRTRAAEARQAHEAAIDALASATQDAATIQSRLDALGDLAPRQTELEARRIQLLTREQLAGFAGELVEGAPCPLCGATHHPMPMDAAHERADLAQVESELKALEQARQQAQALQTQVSVAQAVCLERQKAAEKAASDAAAQETALSQHLAADKGGGSLPEVQAAIQAAQALESQIRRDRDALQLQRKQQEETAQKLRSYQDGLQKLMQEQAQIQGNQQGLAAKLQIFDYAKHLEHDEASLSAKADRFTEELEEVDRSYRKADANRQVLRERLGRTEADLGLARQRKEQAHAQIASLDALLSAGMELGGFASLQEVRTLLRLEIDIPEEQAAIDDFLNELATKRSEYAHKKAQLGERTYDRAQHEALSHHVAQLQMEEEAMRDARGRLRKELEDLREQQARHLALSKQLAQLEARAENFDMLGNLFRADGFVNFVSAVYLRELCQRANQRFQLLTRNRLMLEIGEQNNFLVRDMANGGETRSVKTLSGGQTFQAALSLALALADNIQARNRSHHNFFFLDEGFGSLDRESLQIVFDTLKALRRENRVVGVISHVEDLQQEIDTCLRVRTDEERGSYLA